MEEMANLCKCPPVNSCMSCMLMSTWHDNGVQEETLSLHWHSPLCLQADKKEPESQRRWRRSRLYCTLTWPHRGLSFVLRKRPAARQNISVAEGNDVIKSENSWQAYVTLEMHCNVTKYSIPDFAFTNQMFYNSSRNITWYLRLFDWFQEVIFFNSFCMV